MKITFLVSGSIKSNFSYRPLALARSLFALGHNVSIIAPKADKYNNFIPENITNIDGVKILQPLQFTTKHLEINLIPYLFGAARLLLKEKPDIVYIYKPTPISIIGLIAKFARKTPTVVDFDDLGSEVMKIEGHPWHQRILVEWSEKIAARNADRLVVASTYLFEIYHQQFPNTPIKIIPNGIEMDWLSPVIPTQNQKRIVFLGSINRKNILEPLFDALPQVLHAHPDTQIIILGDGKFLQYFKDKAAHIGITRNITFTGWLTPEEAKSHLRQGDIGYNYMPNEATTRAASNMKVPHYMARGVVPLVTNVGDLVKTIENGTAGYICNEESVHALRETIIFALQDTDRIKKSECARVIASEKLTWESFAHIFSQWIQKKNTKEKRYGKQKIYIITTSVPGNVGGGGIRNYNIIKQLAQKTDADIEVFCISSSTSEAEYKIFESNVRATCHSVPSRPLSRATTLKAVLFGWVPPFMNNFKSSGLGTLVREASEKSLPDILHITQLSAYYCIRPHLSWLKERGVKIIFDCHNVEFKVFKDTLEISPWPKKIIGRFLAPYLKRLEIEASKRADVVLACSTHDVNFFSTYNSQTYLIPNGVDCSEFKQVSKNKNHTLIFMGGVKYPPNADAMRFYISDIHPKVKERIPDIQVLAIGTDTPWLNKMNIHDRSLKPLGFVTDVQPYLNQAAIGICPIRYGSGTRIKIMTYMAAGLPVISTTKGAEGVGYQEGRDIIIANKPEEFADAIVKLFNDPVHYEEIAKNGHTFIVKNYDWNVIGKKLAYIYSE